MTGCCDLRLFLAVAFGAFRYLTVYGSVAWVCPDCGGECMQIITERC